MSKQDAKEQSNLPTHEPTDELARQIYDSDCQLVLSATGGGSQAIGMLLSVPGASRSILEALVPYAAASQDQWLGGPPEHYCTARTARAMAMRGYVRAVELSAPASAAGGVGCTASVASDRPKRGAHRIHVALQTASVTASYSLELQKGLRSRAAEEVLAARMVVNAAAECANVSGRVELGLSETEQVVAASAVAPQPWQDLLSGKVDKVLAKGIAPSGPAIILPGAFNPLHAGHRHIAELGQSLVGGKTQFELSMWNVEKPPLDYIEIEDRLRGFGPDDTVWLSRAATFDEKARLFPGATFLVGADTVVRIAQPCYYGNEAECAAAIGRLAAAGCRFLVFGREAEGVFRTLEELRLPPELAALCQGVPRAAFDEPISSTALRRAAEKKQTD